MKKVEEFKIFSESDLEREFDIIGNQLLETSKDYVETDWTQRIKALKRMQALISSDYIGFENFPTLFLKFAAPLAVQLGDLRSAVVKEAATTIVSAAQTLGDAFELCAERLADTLYRLINSGNKILAETGSECFIEVIKSVVTWRLIPKTLEQFSCKNPYIRTKAITFLQTMLELYPCELFEYAASNKSGFLEKMEQGLKLAIHDASSETRAIARKAFLNYRNYFPARAIKLFKNFDGSIQRAFGELTDTRVISTPNRSTSANFNRPLSNSLTKIDSKSTDKKSRGSLNEVRDLSSTGGTTPETKLNTIKENKTLIIKETKTLDRPIIQKVADKKDQTIEFLITCTSDSNWNTRLSAFENLKKKITEDIAVKILNSSKVLWDQLVSSHLEHIVETNFKVAASALESLIVVTDTYPEKISLALERILPRLLICLSDSKDVISSAGSKLLDLIIDIYIPEDLLALLLKYTSQDLKPITYMKFVEVLTTLALSSTDFFSFNSNTKNYINKLIFILKEIPENCCRNVLRAIEISLDKSKNSSIAILNELPPSDFSLFKGLLQDYKSKYESMFQETIKEVKRETIKQVPILEVKKPAPVTIKEEIKLMGSKQESLKRIQKLNEEDDEIWEKNFDELINLCIECCLDDSLCEATVATLQSIFNKHRTVCHKHIAECLAAISKGFYLDNRHMTQMTEESIENLVIGLPSNTVVPVLIQNIRNQDVPAIQGFIRILTKVIMSSKPSSILPLMRTIMNQMKDSLNHGNADVRKSVVFCLVEIQSLIQADFVSYLEELTPSQQKLVAIYIQRRLSS